MSKKYQGKRFFLFETDLYNNSIIESSVITPLIVNQYENSVNLFLIRDVDYSFEYNSKNQNKYKKRYILTIADNNLSSLNHYENIDNTISTKAIDNNVYKIIADVVYPIDHLKDVLYTNGFDFKLSYNTYNTYNIDSVSKESDNVKYLVCIPHFRFDKCDLDGRLKKII
tara:strand:- start:1869 stop:2375 length:507 start_codon:yes stop_codon:yes gene_type:complete